MPSPFPGMNPYLEQPDTWNDFHSELCKAIKKALVPLVQPEYYVKLNEHVYVHAQDEPRTLVGLADVAVARRKRGPSGNGGLAVLDAPRTVKISTVPYEERYCFLEIFDRKQHYVVAVLELLSPANKKHGPDREQFLGKRSQLLNSTISYVEIDLLRAGPRLPIDDMPRCDYYVLVSPPQDRPHMGFWPIALRQKLPTIPVPLPDPKKKVRLDLQELLHQAYDEAGYVNYIYDGAPQPRLRKEDARWAKRIVAKLKGDAR